MQHAGTRQSLPNRAFNLSQVRDVSLEVIRPKSRNLASAFRREFAAPDKNRMRLVFLREIAREGQSDATCAARDQVRSAFAECGCVRRRQTHRLKNSPIVHAIANSSEPRGRHDKIARLSNIDAADGPRRALLRQRPAKSKESLGIRVRIFEDAARGDGQIHRARSVQLPYQAKQSRQARRGIIEEVNRPIAGEWR